MNIKSYIARYPAQLLFILAMLAGLINLDDYGIAWDETTQRDIGQYSYSYIFRNDNALLGFHAKDYGVAFELPLIMVERVLRLEDTRYIFLCRHLLTHLFFLLGALYCFKLVHFLYGDKLLASLGFLMVLLSPRLYADSFTNTKDIPFMCMFFITFYHTAVAFETRKIKDFAVLGLVTGLMINLRILGVLLSASAILFLVLDCIFDRQLKKNGILALVLLSVTMTTLFVSWPYLWNNPLGNIMDAFSRMSKFNWYGTNLFKGQIIPASQLNWDYIPTWFCISIPLMYLIAGFIGLVVLLIMALRRPLSLLRNGKQRNNLMFAACFFAPVLAAIFLKSVLYDGWRHLYFIYAPFTLLAILALHRFFQTKIKYALLTLLFGTMAYVLFFMVRNHPFQNVYFNELMDTRSPEYLHMRYDLDYWGVSYRQTLEYILENDTARHVNISAENDPGCFNSIILPATQRERIKYLPDTSGATYFITNYRWHQGGYGAIENKKWYSFKVGNNTISAIYKLR